MSEASVIRWLLDGDPAIRWQVMRDLSHEREEVVALERARVATEGWGRALLERQAPQGWWGGHDEEGWMITMDALALLREMELDPSSDQARRAISRVKANLTWKTLGDRPYFEGETEPCINGAILAFGSYFGERCDSIVDRLLAEQLSDGGWNCDAPPSTRSSFHSTIRVLEGLLEYERRCGPTAAIGDARLKAHEYLLERRMLRHLTTDETIDWKWTRFTFPAMWHYDVLRGLGYLRSARCRSDGRAAESRRNRRSAASSKWAMAHEPPPHGPVGFPAGNGDWQGEPLEYSARDARSEMVLHR